jgi:hypothetical protein
LFAHIVLLFRHAPYRGRNWLCRAIEGVDGRHFRRSGITDTWAGLVIEVVAWFVLERQTPHLTIGLAHHDDLRCDYGRDLEFTGQFFFVPDLSVGGFEGLAVLTVVVAVVGQARLRSTYS